jgi:hypothetical protein
MKDDVQRIEPSSRHGSATAVGVLAGFSLTFLTAWAANPLPWGLRDLHGIVPLVAGATREINAVAVLLDPRSLDLRNYFRAMRILLSGLVPVALGVAAAIVVDVIAVAEAG